MCSSSSPYSYYSYKSTRNELKRNNTRKRPNQERTGFRRPGQRPSPMLWPMSPLHPNRRRTRAPRLSAHLGNAGAGRDSLAPSPRRYHIPDNAVGFIGVGTW
ncbi:hypothetical protein JMJ77_0011426, partial [Colletotrichum scovillei]